MTATSVGLSQMEADILPSHFRKPLLYDERQKSFFPPPFHLAGVTATALCDAGGGFQRQKDIAEVLDCFILASGIVGFNTRTMGNFMPKTPCAACASSLM
jgi:hypothetical protein